MILKKINQILPANLKVDLAILYFLIVFAALLELISLGLIPLFISYILSENLSNMFENFNIIFLLNHLPGNNIIIKLSTIIFLIFLFKLIYMIFLSYYELGVIRKIKLFFSKNVYSSYLNKDYNFFLKKNSAELSRNIINETENAVQFLACILTISREIFLIFVIGFLLIIFDPLVTLIGILITSLFVLIFYLQTDKKIKKIASLRIRLQGDLFKHVIETFSVIKDIKIYSKQNFFIKKLINIRNDLDKYLLKRDFYIKLPKIVFEFLAVSLIVFLIVTFTLLNKNTGELFTLLSLMAVAVVRLLPSFNQLSISFALFGSYKKSFEIISQDIESYFSRIKIKQNLNSLEKVKQSNNNLIDIKIDNVSFSYDENKNPVLKGISLEIKRGEMIGLVGKSGAGKSTLINLILSLLEPKKGKIIFPNQKKCGFVPQDIFLLDTSLRNNIALGQKEEDINEKKLKDVIHKSELTNFVKKHNKGFDLILGERGIRISGGEKQRIGLARTLYSDKKIIILDEATSSLDNYTEKLIMDSIINLKKDLTIIIVAHRLTTLRHCDRVIYLEEGYIKDQGKLEYLLQKFPNLNMDVNNKKDR